MTRIIADCEREFPILPSPRLKRRRRLQGCKLARRSTLKLIWTQPVIRWQLGTGCRLREVCQFNKKNLWNCMHSWDMGTPQSLEEGEKHVCHIFCFIIVQHPANMNNGFVFRNRPFERNPTTWVPTAPMRNGKKSVKPAEKIRKK